MTRRPDYPPPPTNATPAEIAQHYRSLARATKHGRDGKLIPESAHEPIACGTPGSWAPIRRHTRALANGVEGAIQPSTCPECAPVLAELNREKSKLRRERKKLRAALVEPTEPQP